MQQEMLILENNGESFEGKERKDECVGYIFPVFVSFPTEILYNLYLLYSPLQSTDEKRRKMTTGILNSFSVFY